MKTYTQYIPRFFVLFGMSILIGILIGCGARIAVQNKTYTDVEWNAGSEKRTNRMGLDVRNIVFTSAENEIIFNQRVQTFETTEYCTIPAGNYIVRFEMTNMIWEETGEPWLTVSSNKLIRINNGFFGKRRYIYSVFFDYDSDPVLAEKIITALRLKLEGN